MDIGVRRRMDAIDEMTLYTLLNKLNEEEKEIIYLWAWKDLSCEAIGEIIGIKYRGQVLSDSTIRYHRDKILRKLRSWAYEPA